MTTTNQDVAVDLSKMNVGDEIQFIGDSKILVTKVAEDKFRVGNNKLMLPTSYANTVRLLRQQGG
jgi:hypothetical protein